MATAIRRNARSRSGLIGASAGYGMYLATIEAAARPALAGFDEHLASAAAQLKATRPTAVNLSVGGRAPAKEYRRGEDCGREDRPGSAHSQTRLPKKMQEHCRMIGQHGLKLIRADCSKRNAGSRSMCSRIVTRDGSRLLITVPPLRRSMRRTIAGCRFTCGLLRRDPGIRVRNSLPGSWANTACRIR